MSTLYKLCMNCLKETRHIDTFGHEYKCTTCQMPSMNGEIFCPHCNIKTDHLEVDNFTYDCMNCGKRQENVRGCNVCEERLAHTKSDNSTEEICINCGNDRNDQIEERSEIDGDGTLRVDIMRVTLNVVRCRHGEHYADRQCFMCQKQKNEENPRRAAGGFSVTRVIKIHKKNQKDPANDRAHGYDDSSADVNYCEKCKNKRLWAYVYRIKQYVCLACYRKDNK